MQAPPGRVQVGGGFCRIEGVKLYGELDSMSRLDSRFTSGLEELLNSGMPEALDDALSVAHHAHPVERRFPGEMENPKPQKQGLGHRWMRDPVVFIARALARLPSIPRAG
jgi:hypothetical protein